MRRQRQATWASCLLAPALLLSATAFTTPLRAPRSLLAWQSKHPFKAPASIHSSLLRISPADQGEPSLLEPGGGPTIVITDGTRDIDIYQSAIRRTLLWVALAGIFGGGLWALVSPNTGEEFFAGYLVEQSLSVDNLFVFLLLFDFFKVPLAAQDKVLNYGIYGAIVMRAAMISLGAAALENFHAILLVFAAILVYSSAKVLIGDEDDEEEDMAENAIVKFSRKLIDSTDTFDGDNFFTIVDGIKKATPLFICMIAIEVSDVVFAVDSVPAVFGVTEVRFMMEESHCWLTLSVMALHILTKNSAFQHTQHVHRTRSLSLLPTCLPLWDYDPSIPSSPRLLRISSTWNLPLLSFWALSGAK
jgi:TerC family integral membrane protein